MVRSRRRSFRIGMGLTAVALAVGGLMLGLCGLRISRADIPNEPSDDNVAQQVTVFAIVATPASIVARTSEPGDLKRVVVMRHGVRVRRRLARRRAAVRMALQLPSGKCVGSGILR